MDESSSTRKSSNRYNEQNINIDMRYYEEFTEKIY